MNCMYGKPKEGKKALFLMLIPSHLKRFGTCGTSSRTNTNIMNCTRAFMKPFQKRELPQPRGKNTLIDCFSRIRTFFLWCFDNKLTSNRPLESLFKERGIHTELLFIYPQQKERENFFSGAQLSPHRGEQGGPPFFTDI